MPRISLTDFIDIVSKSGIPKMTKIQQLKNRAAYTPARDYYLQLREHIIYIHSHNLQKKDIKNAEHLTSYPSKVDNYKKMIIAYKRFWGRKNITWFNPSSELFSQNNVDISINPELGLIIDDEPYLVKLYFKSESLSRYKSIIINQLMEIALRKNLNNLSIKMSVLDIRNSKLIKCDNFNNNSLLAIDGEIAYINEIWDKI